MPEVGGGVCQTSSTLFNAVARANLEIVYRSPHAWPSSYVQKGMDATVNWPNLDFKFKNDTEWPIYIVANYSKQKCTVEIYGMLLPDGVSIDLESTVTRTIDPPSDTKYVQNTKLAAGTQQTTIKKRTSREKSEGPHRPKAGKAWAPPAGCVVMLVWSIPHLRRHAAQAAFQPLGWAGFFSSPCFLRLLYHRKQGGESLFCLFHRQGAGCEKRSRKNFSQNRAKL